MICMNVVPQVVIDKEILVPQGYEGRTLKRYTTIYNSCII